MLISHFNMYVESMFNHVNSIKVPNRNSLTVESVSDLMKVKSYYFASAKILEENNERDVANAILSQPEKEHYDLSKLYVADE